MTGEELPFLPHSEQDVTGSQAGKSYFNPNQQPASIIWAGGPGINVYLEEGDCGLWMSTSGSPPWQFLLQEPSEDIPGVWAFPASL